MRVLNDYVLLEQSIVEQHFGLLPYYILTQNRMVADRLTNQVGPILAIVQRPRQDYPHYPAAIAEGSRAKQRVDGRSKAIFLRASRKADSSVLQQVLSWWSHIVETRMTTMSRFSMLYVLFNNINSAALPMFLRKLDKG